jgi:hypothetical protein
MLAIVTAHMCCPTCVQAADEMQGLPQPDVEMHQQHYVRYRSWQEGARRSGAANLQPFLPSLHSEAVPVPTARPEGMAATCGAMFVRSEAVVSVEREGKRCRCGPSGSAAVRGELPHVSPQC